MTTLDDALAVVTAALAGEDPGLAETAAIAIVDWENRFPPGGGGTETIVATTFDPLAAAATAIVDAIVAGDSPEAALEAARIVVAAQGRYVP